MYKKVSFYAISLMIVFAVSMMLESLLSLSIARFLIGAFAISLVGIIIGAREMILDDRQLYESNLI